MTTLMSFILDTLLPHVNDPDNAKLWLPQLLANMKDSNGNPVLPVQAAEQDIGALTGPNGTFLADAFASNWSVFNNPQSATPDPQSQFPVLTLYNVSIDGLQNVTAQPSAAAPTVAGYGINVPLLFGQYSGTVQQLSMPALSISGGYKMSQALTITGNGPTSWTGEGDFEAVFTDCMMTASATVTVSGLGAARTVDIAVTSLAMTGTTGQGSLPTLTFPPDKFTIEGDINPAAKPGLISLIMNVLTDPQGAGAMIEAMNTMLNSADNLASINSMLGGKSSDLMSGIFGPLPASGMPDDDSGQAAATPVDLFLFDRMRLAINQSDSSWYLPWQLASSTDPVLEPYQNSSIEVPDQTAGGLKYTSIVLTDLKVAGASNAQAPLGEAILATPQITIALDFGTLGAGPNRAVQRQGSPVEMPVPPAPPVTATAGFTLTQQGISPVTLVGDLTATISHLTGAVELTPSGRNVSELLLTVTGIRTSLNQAAVTLTVALTPPDSLLQQIIAKLFLKPAVQSSISTALNKALSGQESQLSQQFTQIARAAITGQLG